MAGLASIPPILRTIAMRPARHFVSLLLLAMVSTSFGGEENASLDQAARNFRQALYAQFQNRPADYRHWLAQWDAALDNWRDAGSPASGVEPLHRWLDAALFAARSGSQITALPKFTPQRTVPAAANTAHQVTAQSRPPANTAPIGVARGPLPRIIRGSGVALPSERTAPPATSTPPVPVQKPEDDVDLEAVLALAQQRAQGQQEPAFPPAGTAGGDLVRSLMELNSQLKEDGILDGPPGAPRVNPESLLGMPQGGVGLPSADFLGNPVLKGMLNSLWPSN